MEDHQHLVEKADLVLVSSKDLIEEAKTLRKDVLFVPNAVDYEFVQQSKPQPGDSLPEDLEELISRQKPIIGFMGALAEWCDYEMMSSAAVANSQWEFVLIGSDYDGSIFETELLHLPNVSWLGPKPYHDLFKYVWSFDAATIPFRITDMTIAMNPVKLFEYFACQKAVVTSPMPECQQYPDVLIAHDGDDFSRQIQKALELGVTAEFQERMDQLAQQNTWSARVNLILDNLPQSSQLREKNFEL